jgi:hypothetical protein
MPFALIAAANTAIAAAKAGCKLYKDIKNAAGDVKEVLDDLKKQFAAKPNPSNEEKRQFNEEVQRVQTIAKTDPGDAFTDIGEQLGKFMDAYDAIIKLFLKEEMESKKVYKGDESIGRRALRRVLIRSRLDSMLASIREEMVYNAPPELGSLWSKFEAMWKQINEEQEIARAEELRKAQIAAWQRARTINKAKALATWIGAILFVQVWMWALMVMIRKSQTYQSLSSYVWQ